jgi:hypothetical protein
MLTLSWFHAAMAKCQSSILLQLFPRSTHTWQRYLLDGMLTNQDRPRGRDLRRHRPSWARTMKTAPAWRSTSSTPRGWSSRQALQGLVLQAEDDAADPKQGTAVAQKLVDAKVNGVIGHETSGTTIPASRIYSMPASRRSRRRPAIRNTPARATTRPSATSPTTNSWAAPWRAMPRRPCKAKRIAVIDDRTAYGKGLADEFIKNVKRGSGVGIVPSAVHHRQGAPISAPS